MIPAPLSPAQEVIAKRLCAARGGWVSSAELAEAAGCATPNCVGPQVSRMRELGAPIEGDRRGQGSRGYRWTGTLPDPDPALLLGVDAGPMLAALESLALVAPLPGLREVLVRFPDVFVFDRDGSAEVRRDIGHLIEAATVTREGPEGPRAVLVPRPGKRMREMIEALASWAGWRTVERDGWPVLSVKGAR